MLQIWQRSKAVMGNCMFQPFLTALIPAWSVWQWIQIWKPLYVKRHWKMLLKRIRVSVKPLSIQAGEVSIPASFREAIQKYSIQQSMNSADGRCHDNARCESMWARMKTELLYDRYDTEKMTTDELKTIIWRYFTSYWNNRRICSTNRGLPPMIKRQQYYASLKEAA